MNYICVDISMLNLIIGLLIFTLCISFILHSSLFIKNSSVDLPPLVDTRKKQPPNYETWIRPSKIETMQSNNIPKCALSLLVRRPVDFPLWLKHHRELGISHFFIRLEDSEGWDEFLKTQEDITYEVSESDTTNNYETLQTRQIDFVNRCITRSHREQPDLKWIFHIDSDELLDGDLSVLNTLPQTTKCVVMQNVEAIFDGKEKTCFDTKKFLKCSNNAPCRSYVNGKAGGRIESDVSIVGPHNFAYKGKHVGDHVKYLDFDTLHVLHFDSCSFGAWSEKFQHLSKTQKIDNIPFPYYKESIKVASDAYDVYKTNVMRDINSLNQDMVYIREDT